MSNDMLNALNFEVTSDGRTGREFAMSLRDAGYRLDNLSYQLLRSEKFVSTKGQVYKPGIVMGDEFGDHGRITSRIHAEAVRQRYLLPPAELAPLLLEVISDEDMDRMNLFRLVVMHEPIADFGNKPNVLGIRRDGRSCFLAACRPRISGRTWDRGYGFVFLAPEE